MSVYHVFPAVHDISPNVGFRVKKDQAERTGSDRSERAPVRWRERAAASRRPTWEARLNPDAG